MKPSFLFSEWHGIGFKAYVKGFSIYILLVYLLTGCDLGKSNEQDIPQHDSIIGDLPMPSSIDTVPAPREQVLTGDVLPDSIVNFAETLKGVQYKYASSDPREGFDCSGFISYVFNRFNIKVPRSSVEFTNLGQEIALPLAKRGDLILFTGTDSTIRIVGHMGIVTNNSDTLRFIHSTSGRQYGVTETALNNYYKGRFVKVIRIFS